LLTAHLFGEVTQAGLLEIWSEFVSWRSEPREEEAFHTKMNGKTVWVIEDGQAFTLLYPEDY